LQGIFALHNFLSSQVTESFSAKDHVRQNIKITLTEAQFFQSFYYMLMLQPHMKEIIHFKQRPTRTATIAKKQKPTNEHCPTETKQGVSN
jgi:hypothetical protein